MSFSNCLEDYIGPGLQSCPQDFDFSIKFEELFFSLAPAALFILLSMWRLGTSSLFTKTDVGCFNAAVVLARRPDLVNAPALQLGKLGVVVSYASLELALVTLVATGSFKITNSAVSAASLRLAAAICIAPLSFLENNRSPRPSMLLGAYLSLTLLLDAAQVRTLWLSASTRPETAYASIFTAGAAIKAAAVRWGTKSDHSPEETSGIYSLSIYAWVNRLFISGYRNVLRVPDLYPLDTAMASKGMRARFAKHYNSSSSRQTKHKLILVLACTFAVQLLLPIPARVILIGFKLSQPFFINSLLQYLAGTSSSDFTTDAGYGLIGASFLIYSGIALSTSLYWYLHRRAQYMLRGALVSAIYTKATDAMVAIGDNNASVTLMSIDIERIYQVEVAISSFLLYQHIGPAFVGPLILAILCALALTTPGKQMTKGQRLMNSVQKRVGLTSSAIGCMKNLKISGLAVAINSAVQTLRVSELSSGKSFRKILVLAALCAWIPFVLGPPLTFAIAQRTLGASGLYTSLSYLTLMLQPLANLGGSFAQCLAALACLGRIQSFLDSTDRNDTRLLRSTSQEYSEKSMPNNTKPVSPRRSPTEYAMIFTLNNINLKIARGTLTIIVGPIASGKSSLCRALLGEMPYSHGRLLVDNQSTRTGYCDQNPFLANGTIRENIVGFSAFDADRYAAVIEAPVLKDKCDNLPHGHDTTVGSNGITLSGGQKQHLSLARTLYLQTDLLIFDDVFSGLDADMEDQVFRRVFGSFGLLRKRGATVVLSTHSIRHLPNADQVVALGQDGEVVEQGTFTDLMALRSYVASLGIKSAAARETSTVKEVPENGIPSVPEEKVSRARQTGDVTVYKTYFKSMGLFLTGLLFFLGLAFGFFSTFSTVWLSFWTVDAAKASPSHSNGYYIGGYALYQFLAITSLFTLALLLLVVAVSRAGASLYQTALTTLVHAPLRFTICFFTTMDQGVTTNLFSQDLNLIDTELPSALLDTIYSVSLTLGQAGVLTSSSPYLAISYPFIAVCLYMLQKFYLRTSRQLRVLDLESKSPLYTHFLDTTRGIITMRSSSFVDENRSKNFHLLDTSQRPAYLLASILFGPIRDLADNSIFIRWLNCVLNFVVAGLAILLTTLATQLRSSAGITGASLVTLLGIGSNLSGIIQSYTLLETSIGAISRLRSFSETVMPEDQDCEDIHPPEDWPQRGEVLLKGVSASYWKEGEAQEPALALKNLSLDIPAGEKIAICGRTGSGKSALIALLLKLLDPLSSSSTDCIKLDNLSLGRIDRVTLRQRVIAVPQEAVFLPDGSTFMENLDPFWLSTLEDAETVLKIVGLWDLVSERGGLESGMAASTLSQGQRQLFSLARAVLHRKIRAWSLLGSSVDQETERKMQEIIRKEFGNYTVIAVSHRLDMIMDFGGVVVMDYGEIVEIGNPIALTKEPGTRFGDLCAVRRH
ncbi:putative ABC multidrug transporter [Xylariaceae sp. FL0255]|nr:putative ABC multidrug transporter [Xylariaceae sp. FL0255]